MNVWTIERRWAETPSATAISYPKVKADIADSFNFQAARVRAIQVAYRKAEFEHPSDNAARAGQIRSLGLLGKEKDTKVVTESKWWIGRRVLGVMTSSTSEVRKGLWLLPDTIGFLTWRRPTRFRPSARSICGYGLAYGQPRQAALMAHPGPPHAEHKAPWLV